MESSGGQLELSEVTERFVASGVVSKVDDLPAGSTDMTARELKFVLGVLEHGQMARAATEAGYSADSAGAIASETLRRPKVFSFYRRCLDKVASKAELVIGRVYERSVIYHAKALEAEQQLRDANEWLLFKSKTETGKSAKEVHEYELARDRAQRDGKHFATLANQTDALLGQLLGKINGLNISGEVRHNHTHDVRPAVTVPQDALQGFAQMRRDVVVARGEAAMPATGGTN